MSEATDEARLKQVVFPLGDAYCRIKPQFEQQFPGSTLTVAQGYRTPDMQNAAHLGGASRFDGTKTFSLHQWFFSRAIDVAVIENGAIVSDGRDNRYEWLGIQFEAEGFEWGGRFSRPDFDHFQMPSVGPTASQVAMGFDHYQQGGEDATPTA